MNALTEKQIDYITQIVNESTIQSAEMKEDLIDHFCCAIEADMQKGTSFETAYNKAYYYICPEGFDEIQRETIYLLTFKNIKKMNKLLYLSGYLSAIGATTTLFMKLNHVPFGGMVLFFTAVILLLVFLPTLFTYLYKNDLSQSYGKKIMYVSGFVGIELLGAFLLSEWMHWPFGGLVFVMAVLLLNFAFFPMWFLKMYRKTS